MANTLTMHGPAFGRLCFVAPGARVRINGVEMTADGEPVTRAFEGADNLPAIEAFATKNMGSPQKAEKIAEGVYLLTPRQADIPRPEASDGGSKKGK